MNIRFFQFQKHFQIYRYKDFVLDSCAIGYQRKLSRDKNNHLQMNKNKPQVSVAIIGQVESGKSTTLGHLLYKCAVISQRQFKKLEKESAEINANRLKFAWIMKKIKPSRQPGITIDISHVQFNTARLDCTIIDAPGFKDFVNNMITGISQADCALVMISASEGEFEAGISKYGQTREHIRLAYTLRVKQLIIAINKMDQVKYSKDRFDEIKKEILVLLKKVGYNPEIACFLPISGWTGENMLQNSQNLEWYKGPTLLEALDSIVPPKQLTEKPLRVSIKEILQIEVHRTVATVRVQTGILKDNTILTIAPGNLKTQVNGINMHHEKLTEASPGFEVRINLEINDNEIKKGCVLGQINNCPPRQAETFIAEITIMNHPGCIRAQQTTTIKLSCTSFTCKIVEIKCKIDTKTGILLDLNPEYLKNGDSAIVLMKPDYPLCCEVFEEFPPLGRFTVREMNQIVATGIIKEVLQAKE